MAGDKRRKQIYSRPVFGCILHQLMRLKLTKRKLYACYTKKHCQDIFVSSPGTVFNTKMVTDTVQNPPTHWRTVAQQQNMSIYVLREHCDLPSWQVVSGNPRQQTTDAGYLLQSDVTASLYSDRTVETVVYHFCFSVMFISAPLNTSTVSCS